MKIAFKKGNNIEVNKINYLSNKKNTLSKSLFKEFSSNGSLYLLTLPGIIFIFMFFYIPVSGIVLAFKNYNYIDGIYRSPWVGFKNFEFFFKSDKFIGITFNTIYINLFHIVLGVIISVSIAILINEVNNRYLKKTVQSIIFMPHFFSWVIISGIIYALFAFNVGAINGILSFFGIEKVNWYSNAAYWRPILIGAKIWKTAGYSSVIYLATIASIDTTIYEAATIDGANRIQRILHITIPYLKPTITILTLLSIGRIFYGDFGMVYAIVKDNGLLLSTTEVIDTYVFRAMRTTGDFSFSAAIGLYQSMSGFILVMICNKLAKKYGETALF